MALFDDKNPERKVLAEEFFSKIGIYNAHISELTVAEMDYLLSWNFHHNVRRRTKDVVKMVSTLRNLKQVEIITPGELLWEVKV